MPVLNNALAGAAGQSGGAAVGPIKSVRFNDGDGAYLNRNMTSGKTTYTVSVWVKRSSLSGYHAIFGSGTSGTNTTALFFDTASGKFYAYGSGGANYWSTELFRDLSAWYHVVCSVSSNNATVYVNGKTVTFSPSLAFNTLFGNLTIGAGGSAGTYPFDGYMADFHFIDGSALDATSFGAFDENGVWQHAEYSGTYGTDGAHLFDFANESGIGNDSSGNDNDFTVNNLTASTLDYSTSGGTVANAGNALDGNDNTYSQTNSGANSTYTFSPAISVSSGRIDLRARNDSNLTYKAVTNAGTITFTLQGTWPGSGHVDYPGWYYISNPSVTSISQIILETSDSSVNWTFTGFQVAGSPSSVGDQFVTTVPGSDLDVLFDVPTNGTQSETGAGGEVSGNYCTLNPLDKATVAILSDGNLRTNTSGAGAIRGTFKYPKTGKWYYEVEPINDAQYNTGYFHVGIATADANLNTNPGYDTTNEFTYWQNGSKTNNVAYGASFTAGDIIGVAFDADAGSLTFYKNGVSQGVNSTGLTGEYFPYAPTWSYNAAYNFGQRPFEHPVSNYLPLSTTNLPTPTVADGSDYFDVKLYTGNASTQTISGLDFSPDLVWIKSRSTSGNHNVLTDRVRGDGFIMYSNLTTTENATSYSNYVSLTSDGFSVGDGLYVNRNTDAMVGWAWDAGNSNTSISVGGLNSAVYDQSATWSSSSTLNGSYGAVTRAFDGNLSTAADSGISTTYSTITTSSFTVNSTLRVYCPNGSGPNLTWRINNTEYGAYAGVSGWNTIPFTGTVTNFEAKTNTSTAQVAAVEVDGKILVDTSATPPSVPSSASTCRTNQTAGFSIVSYAPGGDAQTIGHNLNQKPEMIIVKNREHSYDWYVYHKDLDPSIPQNKFLKLNDTSAVSDSANAWNDTAPTSSVFSVKGGPTAYQNADHIAYCFAPVEGYSAFGSYTGNGSTDGPFVFTGTGFRPRFLLIKNTSANADWQIYDSAREPFNVIDEVLFPSGSYAESQGVGYSIDFLSNGFKVRHSYANINGNGNKIIYAAFAENPFQANGGLAR